MIVKATKLLSKCFQSKLTELLLNRRQERKQGRRKKSSHRKLTPIFRQRQEVEGGELGLSQSFMLHEQDEVCLEVPPLISFLFFFYSQDNDNKNICSRCSNWLSLYWLWKKSFFLQNYKVLISCFYYTIILVLHEVSLSLLLCQKNNTRGSLSLDNEVFGACSWLWSSSPKQQKRKKTRSSLKVDPKDKKRRRKR